MVMVRSLVEGRRTTEKRPLWPCLKRLQDSYGLQVTIVCGI
jgi:hypothetical protein